MNGFLRSLLSPLLERAARATSTDPVDRPPLLNRALWLLSLPYGAVTDLKYRLYASGLLRRGRLPVPTVSVGNLAVGGTGKTPFTIALARELARRGARPLVINKDYGGAEPSRPKLVSDGTDLFLAPPQVSDEAALEGRSLLSRAGATRHARLHPDDYLPPSNGRDDEPGVPVVACRSRRLGFAFARPLLPFDMVLLDDAFQHHELARDFDIVLLDALDPWGFSALFPLGRLREPLSRLRRAHAVVLSGAERIPADEARMIAEEAARRHGAREVTLSHARPGTLVALEGMRAHAPDLLRGKRVLAFSGLGSPRRFRETLLAAFPSELETIEFPDHESYSFLTLGRIEHAEARFAPDLIVTTGKDAVKLPAAFKRARAGRLFAFERDVSVDPRLAERILALLPARRPEGAA